MKALNRKNLRGDRVTIWNTVIEKSRIYATAAAVVLPVSALFNGSSRHAMLSAGLGCF
jgi:hypothetical protein